MLWPVAAVAAIVLIAFTLMVIAPHPVPDDLDVTLRGVWAFGRRWDVVANRGQVDILRTEPGSAVP